MNKSSKRLLAGVLFGIAVAGSGILIAKKYSATSAEIIPIPTAKPIPDQLTGRWSRIVGEASDQRKEYIELTRNELSIPRVPGSGSGTTDRLVILESYVSGGLVEPSGFILSLKCMK